MIQRGFLQMMTELTRRRPAVIWDEFYTCSEEWASRFMNQRSQILLDALTVFNIDLANVGETYSV